MAAWDALGAFTFLWAQVMLLQVVKLAHPLFASETPWSLERLFWPLLMGTSCLLAILLPQRGWATLQLLLASLVTLQCTGSFSNHVFMDAAVCLAALLAFSRDRARWQAQCVHAVRAFLVALYLVTALHKMNAAWEDPKYSCSTLMLGGVLALRPLRPLLPFVPMALVPRVAVLTELLIPLLLSLRCLRLAAVLGCLFHLAICQMLSPMSVYPFSLLMVPPYVLVIPGRAVGLLKRLGPRAPLLVPFYLVLSAAWTGLVAEDLARGEAPFEYPPYGAWAPGVVWCTLALALLALAALWPSGIAEGQEARPTNRGRLVALGVLLFGLTPYFGLRNHPALAMFSNLRTEGGRSNHLFLGDDLDLLGWQRDYVTVQETDIPALLLAQVDLAPLFTKATKRALEESGAAQEFWIAPPLKAWPYPATRPFVPYSMPLLELRRRLRPLRAAGAKGKLRYSRTLARADLRWPWLWHALGVSNLERDVVSANLTYDLEVGDEELEAPLSPLQELFARFRTFDAGYSPCRH